MAKFYGNVGYGETVDVGNGIYEEQITERTCYGEFSRNTSSKLQSSGNLNDNVILTNEISILADPYAMEHYHAIRYIEFHGVKWKVSTVELVYPRLILTTGGEYNA